MNAIDWIITHPAVVFAVSAISAYGSWRVWQAAADIEQIRRDLTPSNVTSLFPDEPA